MRSPIMNEPVIVFGADVTHPAAGEISRPSIAAIVGSMDPVPCKFQVTLLSIAISCLIINYFRQQSLYKNDDWNSLLTPRTW